MFWKKAIILDAEMDIEGQPVIGVDRRGNRTVFGMKGDQRDEYIICTEEKHAEFLARFRKKLGRVQADYHRSMGITLMDAKWLDPECHAGCNSLVLKHRIEALTHALTELSNRVHSGYDFNADPDSITLLVSSALEAQNGNGR